MDEQPHAMPSPQYPDGSRVVCADGQTLGEVVATYREYLIVERGYFFPVTFYVPYAAVAEAGRGDIVLVLSGPDALAEGWDTPPEDPFVPVVPVQPEPAPAPTAPAEHAAAAVPSDAPPVTPAPEPAEATTEPDAAPIEAAVESTEQSEPQPASADQMPTPETPPQEEVFTTAPPAVVVEEPATAAATVDVQSFQPDASVPPPDEPEEAETVAVAPPFVGIPGRRLTDAELWSLLEPKDGPSESGEQPEDIEDEKGAPDKPNS